MLNFPHKSIGEPGRIENSLFPPKIILLSFRLSVPGEIRKTGGETGREFLEGSSARGWLTHKVKVFMGYKSCAS